MESVRDVESVRASRERSIIMFEEGHAGLVESVRDVESVRASGCVESVRASRDRNIMFDGHVEGVNVKKTERPRCRSSRGPRCQAARQHRR